MISTADVLSAPKATGRVSQKLTPGRRDHPESLLEKKAGHRLARRRLKAAMTEPCARAGSGQRCASGRRGSHPPVGGDQQDRQIAARSGTSPKARARAVQCRSREEIAAPGVRHDDLLFLHPSMPAGGVLTLRRRSASSVDDGVDHPVMLSACYLPWPGSAPTPRKVSGKICRHRRMWCSRQRSYRLANWTVFRTLPARRCASPLRTAHMPSIEEGQRPTMTVTAHE